MKNYLINTIISSSNIEVSFSREEYRLYKEGKINLLDVKILNKLRTDFRELLCNKDFYRFMVSGMAFIMAFSSSATVYAASNPGDIIDKIGNKILAVVFQAMKWVCIIKAGTEIGKEIGAGGDNSNKIIKTALKYLLAFGVLLLLPSFFEWIEEACAPGML